MRKISEEIDKNVKETYFDNDKDGVVHKRSIDVEPILKNNKGIGHFSGLF